MTTSSWEKRGTYGYKLGSTPMTKLQLKLLEALIYTRDSESYRWEREMEVVQVLHMNGGIDETSYGLWDLDFRCLISFESAETFALQVLGTYKKK